MKRKRITLTLVMLFTASVAVHAQTRFREDVNSQLPKTLATTLDRRLEQFLHSYKREEYETVYDLLRTKDKIRAWEERATVLDPMRSKESYLTYRKAYYPKLVKFTPTSFRQISDRYEVRGEAKVRYKSGVFNEERIIFAYLENGKWFFSEIGTEIIDRC
jgi:hypothetical protein